MRSKPAPPGDTSKAVLFTTCSVNYNEPQVGKDAVEVSRESGVALTCPKQNCCGMPALEPAMSRWPRGWRGQRRLALPAVEQGKKIVAINPTCSYMLRKRVPRTGRHPEARRWPPPRWTSPNSVRAQAGGQFNRDFPATPGRVAYHLPCHLKAQNIGFRSRDMMKLIPGRRTTLVEQCCGHDGTFAMKKEFFPLSMLAGKKAFDEMTKAEAT